MMALNIEKKEDLIEVYSKHLHDVIVGSLSGREEVVLLESGLYPLEEVSNEDDDNDWSEENYLDEEIIGSSLLSEVWNKSKPTQEKEVDYSESEAMSLHFTNMVNESLEEISYMNQVKVDEILIRKGVDVDINDLKFIEKKEDIEFKTGYESFEEDGKYLSEIPYKIILKSTKDEQEKTVIIGGY